MNLNERKAQLCDPKGSVSCSVWLEEYLPQYEACKDTRLLHEYYNPEEKTGLRVTVIYPDDLRYTDIKKSLFVEKYERSLEILEELNSIVSEMVLSGYPMGRA